ncbi:MAG: ABC transporter ATP-binding protein [Salinirussus sp.]
MSSQALEDREQSAGKLRGTDIVTGYGNHTVIHGVSIESRDGVTCLFGPNGSGKSTLINALNGAVPIWEGSVEFEGEDISDVPPHEIVDRGIVTLPQDGGLFPSLTVEENLKVGGHTLRDEDLIAERVDEVYETFPLLEEKRDDTARSLSGGQQMILSFGRATVLDADVYLLDEPSAGLAPSLIDDLLDNIELLVEKGAEVILVEQNVQASLRLADYVYVLAQGRVEFEGTTEELGEMDRILDLYLGIE